MKLSEKTRIRRTPHGTPSGTEGNGLLFWLVNAAGWSLFASFHLVTFSRETLEIPGFTTWYVIKTVIGFILTAGMRGLYRRVSFQDGKATLKILGIFAVSAIAANIWYFGEFVIIWIQSGAAPETYTLSKHYLDGVFFGRTFFNLWIMSSWSALYFGIRFRLAWLDQKARAERMELLAEKAQLEMLRYQINPHFLFNALSSISAMAGEEGRDVKVMIRNLSAILRYSLDGNRSEMVPLSEEMEIVTRYLDIEKTRFEELIDVSVEVDPAAREFPVPRFLIHPLVENAVKYGMKSERMPLSVGIKAEVEGDMLVVSVFDSGPWVERPAGAAANVEGTGTGLSNVRRRLEAAYPGNHRFDVEHDESGVVVRMAIVRGKAGAA